MGVSSAKVWVRWISTIVAITAFGAMLYVGVTRGTGNVGFLFLALVILCSFAYKWASRP